MTNTNGTLNGVVGPVRRILVVGDNRLASSILSGLKSQSLEIHQVSHAQARDSSDADVTIHKIDLSPSNLTSLFKSVAPDLIFSTQSAGSYEFQKQLIDAAVETHVPRFVPAEFCHDTLNKKIQARLPPYGERAKVIRYLHDQAAAERIEWAAVAAGCFPLEHAISSGNIGFDLKWQSATVPSTGDDRFGASSSAWVGRVALALVLHWHDITNEYLYASGMVTSANEILRCLESHTKQQWEVGHSDVAEMVQEAERRFERGFPDAAMFLMERSVLYDGSIGALEPFVKKDARARLGLGDGEKLEHVIGRAVHEHEHHGNGGCGCD